MSSPFVVSKANDFPNFFSMSMEDLKDFVSRFGRETYRAQQVFRWVYVQRRYDFSEMTNLSKSFRLQLGESLHFELPELVSHLKSVDGTQKYLFRVDEKLTFESVLIPNQDRLTLCVSSEIGCNMACRFCFTGKQKLKRRLKASEIVGQFLHVQDRLEDDQRISNIVFMGMGEPLDNVPEVFKAIEILTNQWGVGFPRRRITVSTSGIVPQMHEVARNGVRLAVSLNGVTDEVRSYLMPINKKYPLKDLLKACRQHYETSKDPVTFEYVLIKDVTDSLEDAQRLFEITRAIPCKLNIIPFNEHPQSGFLRPDEARVEAFQRLLIQNGARVYLRKTMGRDIFAACGQLTSEFEGKPRRLELSSGFAHS